MTIQDPKKISPKGLQGLARLLNLMTTYFKVEIGERLLTHAETITNDPSVQKISFGLIEEHASMRTIVYIINIFHLLPPAAAGMVAKVVNRVLDIEERLRRTKSSPFREPLIKYLNKYHEAGLDFFHPEDWRGRSTDDSSLNYCKIRGVNH